MIPLGDASRRPIHFPIMTLTIITINVIVFILELSGGDDFINYWSLVPANIITVHGIITVFTSMFMHAGWEHIIGNMVFFWAFGPEIEDLYLLTTCQERQGRRAKERLNGIKSTNAG